MQWRNKSQIIAELTSALAPYNQELNKNCKSIYVRLTYFIPLPKGAFFRNEEGGRYSDYKDITLYAKKNKKGIKVSTRVGGQSAGFRKMLSKFLAEIPGFIDRCSNT